MRTLRTAAAGAAALASLLAVSAIPAASAAETVGADGWMCTTAQPPVLPASGPDRARLQTLRPTASFDSAGKLTMRFAAPVAAGASLSRTGAGADRTATSSCTAIGFVDDQTQDGQRYRYRVDAPQRDRAVLKVGNRLAVDTSPGRVVLVIDASLWSQISSVVDYYYTPALKKAGWTVVKEMVGRTDSPADIRSKLRARVAEDPQTNAAFLIGRVPVVFSGNASGRGGRPTDAYYADVNGAWTDSTVNTTVPADDDHDNVPGDGKFDQDAPPSARELAVGRLDTSGLTNVTRFGSAVDEASEIQAYLMRMADQSTWGLNTATRAESFVIDAGDPAGTSPAKAGWQAASAVSATTASGSRAELDIANALTDGWVDTRPTLLFQRGRATASALSTWTGTTAGDIANPTSAGAGRFVVTSGPGVEDWHRGDALLRAALTGWQGADAAAADSLDLDGLELGGTLGASFLAAGDDPDRGGDPMATLIGDPTQRLEPNAYAEVPSAKVAAGCTDVAVDLTVYSPSDATSVTADIYRSLDGGPMQRIAANTPLAWSDTVGAFTARYTDAGIVTASPNRDARYEVRPKARYTTGRGSFEVASPPSTSSALRLHCVWECGTPTGDLPSAATDKVGASRAHQVESRVDFGADGTTARIALTQRFLGRTVTGVRVGSTEPAADDPCGPDKAASAYLVDGLKPGVINEARLTDTAFGTVPVLFGKDLPGRDNRGTVVVVTERTIASKPDVSSALSAWEDTLRSDGYAIEYLTVDRTDSVASVRSRLKTIYDRDPQQVGSAVFIGHVPVPYSGTGNYDGHSNHVGAWSTDAPYADLNGAWTDSSVNIPTTERSQNRNIPGDGKFDQNVLPSTAELSVGRIDFSDMPSLGSSEATLTAAYLRRDVQYRTGNLKFKPMAFTRENFGFVPAGYLFNVSPVVGPENVKAGWDPYTARAEAKTEGPYLLAYTAGGGSYGSSSGIGTTTDPVPALFMGSLGSYYGDWDSTDNFMRGHLAQGLGVLWENWSVDGMALGESIGDTVRRNMDLKRSDLRDKLNSLQGDPTLRAYPMGMPTNAQTFDGSGDGQTCQHAGIRWTPSTDARVQGYYIERRGFWSEPWTRITGAMLPRTASEFVDPDWWGFQSLEYRVVPVRKEVTSRGTFTNLGVGTQASVGPCD